MKLPGGAAVLGERVAVFWATRAGRDYGASVLQETWAVGESHGVLVGKQRDLYTSKYF